MAETTYYVVQYAGKEYRTADASSLLSAIENGDSFASILATGHGENPIEVTLALGAVPVAIERRVRKDNGGSKTMIL